MTELVNRPRNPDVDRRLTQCMGIINSCIQDGWNISSLQSSALKAHNLRIAKEGNDIQKKEHARMLYTARIKTALLPEHEAYLQIETHFRILCAPLLQKEESFKTQPINMEFLEVGHSSAMSAAAAP